MKYLLLLLIIVMSGFLKMLAQTRYIPVVVAL